MTERRYSEEEVAAIFQRAAEAQAGASGPAAPDGRTLAELQAIGADVGIPPELVARAARSLDRDGEAIRESFLGFPLAVGRTVELGRHLSPDEWQRLVTDLQVTFGATGRVRDRGEIRQWSNGNLRATLEPAPGGDRLRIRTLKGDARGMMQGGIVLVLMALALFLTFFLSGGPAEDWGTVILLALLGAGVFGAGALQLPGWAARRLDQMDGIAERLMPPPSHGA